MPDILSMPYYAAYQDHHKVLEAYENDSKSYEIVEVLTFEGSHPSRDDFYGQISDLADEIRNGTTSSPQLLICDWNWLSIIAKNYQSQYTDPKFSFLKERPMLLICDAESLEEVPLDMRNAANIRAFLNPPLQRPERQSHLNSLTNLMRAFFAGKLADVNIQNVPQIISMPVQEMANDHKQIISSLGKTSFVSTWASMQFLNEMDRVANQISGPPELLICDRHRLARILRRRSFEGRKYDFLRTTPMIVVCEESNVDKFMTQMNGAFGRQCPMTVIGVVNPRSQLLSNQDEPGSLSKMIAAFYVAKDDNAYGVDRASFERAIAGKRGTVGTSQPVKGRRADNE